MQVLITRRILRQTFVTMTVTLAAVSVSVCAHAALGDCVQPVSSGSNPVATDCLFVLRSAVGLETCAPECICAPKGSLPATAVDALLCLNAAVSGSSAVSLDCPCATGTTSTTLPAEELTCSLRYHLPTTQTVGTLSWNTDYSLIQGLFPGPGAQASCTGLLAPSTIDFIGFENNQATKQLAIGLGSTPGITGPIDLARCLYETRIPDLAADDFTVTVTSSLDPSDAHVDVEVVIAEILCGDDVTTTTTTTLSTTTTTTTTTTTVSSTTTTTLPPCDVRMRMTSSDAVTSLTFEVSYASIFGIFTGYGANVLCTTLASPPATVTYDNNVGPKILTVGLVAGGAGLAGPTDIAKCVYEQYRLPLLTDQFRISVTDSQGPSGSVMSTLEVTSIECPGVP